MPDVCFLLAKFWFAFYERFTHPKFLLRKTSFSIWLPGQLLAESMKLQLAVSLSKLIFDSQEPAHSFDSDPVLCGQTASRDRHCVLSNRTNPRSKAVVELDDKSFAFCWRQLTSSARVLSAGEARWLLVFARRIRNPRPLGLAVFSKFSWPSRRLELGPRR